MPDGSSNSAEVIFIDRDRVIDELRRAVAEARSRHAEIARVFLCGSLVRGDWTADSDADLIVVVRKNFAGVLDRAPYQIFSPAIATDTLVCSEAEFASLSQAPDSFLAQALASALEL